MSSCHSNLSLFLMVNTVADSSLRTVEYLSNPIPLNTINHVPKLTPLTVKDMNALQNCLPSVLTILVCFCFAKMICTFLMVGNGGCQCSSNNSKLWCGVNVSMYSFYLEICHHANTFQC